MDGGSGAVAQLDRSADSRSKAVRKMMAIRARSAMTIVSPN
jgi:hypothetical protein